MRIIKQSARMLVGLTAMIAVAQLPPRTLSRWSWLAYLVGLVLLVLVLFFGSGRGADRWLDLGLVRFQPSELMKLAVPITVAALLSEKVLPPSFSTNALVLTIIGIPVALIVRQPDLGTALLVGASGIFVENNTFSCRIRGPKLHLSPCTSNINMLKARRARKLMILRAPRQPQLPGAL